MKDRSIVPHRLPSGSYLSCPTATFTFIPHSGFCTQILAYTLDSLVRVSRRVNENHFVMISNEQVLAPHQYNRRKQAELCSPHPRQSQDKGKAANGAHFRTSVDHTVGPTGYNIAQVQLPSHQLSAAQSTDHDSPKPTGAAYYCPIIHQAFKSRQTTLQQ